MWAKPENQGITSGMSFNVCLLYVDTPLSMVSNSMFDASDSMSAFTTSRILGTPATKVGYVSVFNCMCQIVVSGMVCLGVKWWIKWGHWSFTMCVQHSNFKLLPIVGRLYIYIRKRTSVCALKHFLLLLDISELCLCRFSYFCNTVSLLSLSDLWLESWY